MVGLGQLFLLQHQHCHLQALGMVHWPVLVQHWPVLVQQHLELPWVGRHWCNLWTNVCGLFDSNDQIHFTQ